MKCDNTVDEQIKLYARELSTYNTYFLSILIKIRFLVCYNILIIIGLILFSIMYLMIGEVLAVYLKRKIKRLMRNAYIESMNVLSLLGDSIEWDKNRRKFRKKPPKEALTAINTFYSIIQSIFFPFRKGVNYYNIISLVNIFAMLLVLVISFKILVEYYS